MVKIRVIPIILIDGYSVIKTIKFKERRNLGNPITVAKIYDSRNVDEMIILDIDATKNNFEIDDYTIEEIASECFMPLAVGGGLKNEDDISLMLRKGADKVVLNTEILRNPAFLKSASQTFGAQAIVASIDVKTNDKGTWDIHSHSGIDTDIKLFEWVKEVEALGAGEIFLNSVNCDGEMKGFDLTLIEKVSSLVNIPVVAAGGMGNPGDAVKAIKAGASAVAAASIYHFTNFTPNDVKSEMNNNDIPVRLVK